MGRKWQRSRDLSVATYTGDTIVAAIVCGPLAVHRAIGHPRHWSITHVPSRLAIPTQPNGRVLLFRTRRHAMWAAEYLLRVADWTQPPDTIRAHLRRRWSAIVKRIKEPGSGHR
jgi:hypothetical protein